MTKRLRPTLQEDFEYYQALRARLEAVNEIHKDNCACSLCFADRLNAWIKYQIDSAILAENGITKRPYES